jgi:crotonobetainyl-CoA:carnitine CoA-transferase CaiB-like acyl-CoA transferase
MPAAGSKKKLQKWCRLFGREDLLGDEPAAFEKLFQDMGLLKLTLADAYAQYTQAEILQKLDECDLPNGPVLNLQDALASVQAVNNGSTEISVHPHMVSVVCVGR